MWSWKVAPIAVELLCDVQVFHVLGAPSVCCSSLSGTITLNSPIEESDAWLHPDVTMSRRHAPATVAEMCLLDRVGRHRMGEPQYTVPARREGTPLWLK